MSIKWASNSFAVSDCRNANCSVWCGTGVFKGFFSQLNNAAGKR